MIRKFFSIEVFRNFICFLRAFYFIKILKKLKKIDNTTPDVWKETIDSNLRHVFDEGVLPSHPKKIKKLFGVNLKFAGGNINYLHNLLDTKDNIFEKRILVVGPRNESEIFNLYSKGYDLKKIDAIDLFSYSKKIMLADAHTYLKKENYYDIIFLGWVLAYSNNKEIMLKNLSKNLKDNGLLIIGYSISDRSDKEILETRGYLISSPHERIRNEDELDIFFHKNKFNIVKKKTIYKKDTSVKLTFKLKKNIG